MSEEIVLTDQESSDLDDFVVNGNKFRGLVQMTVRGTHIECRITPFSVPVIATFWRAFTVESQRRINEYLSEHGYRTFPEVEGGFLSVVEEFPHPVALYSRHDLCG